MYITVIKEEIPMVHLDGPRGRPVCLATPSLIYSRVPRWAECNIKALADDRTLQLHYQGANEMHFINMLRNAFYLNALQYLFQNVTPFFSLFPSNCFGFKPKIIFSGALRVNFRADAPRPQRVWNQLSATTVLTKIHLADEVGNITRSLEETWSPVIK